MDTDFFDIELDNQLNVDDLKNDELLYRVSSYHYHKKLSEVMEKNVYICGADTRISDVANNMAARKISSAVVVDDEKKPIGIVTERDMVKNIVARNLCNFGEMKISDIMTSNPVYLDVDDNLFNALSVFSKYEIKHLPIVKNSKVAGIITFRQIVKIRHYDPLVLIGKLEQAKTTEDYRNIRHSMIDMVAERLAANIDPFEIIVMLSTINASIHKYLIDRSIKECGEEPPVKYTIFVTGSLGRRENLLFPDQDFGMIIEDYDDKYYEEYDRYFMKLALKLSGYLDESGFPFCKGNIMGQNPTWRKRLSEWKLHLHYILEGKSSQSVRYATLIFDAAYLFGDDKLFNDFNKYTFREALKHHTILREMHYSEEATHKVPLNIFQQFITEKEEKHRGKIDMKRSALIFIIESVRILAARHGIMGTATLDRLKKLVKKDILNENDAEYFESSFRIILQHALQAQVGNYKKYGAPSYYLNPNLLSPRKKRILKSSFKAITRLQELVAGEFGELLM